MKQDAASRIALSVLSIIEHVGLAVIIVATVIAGYLEVMVMVNARTVTLADLLLMFLYLEILAMVAVYYRSGQLPVRFPIYIAIVALARYIVLDTKNMSDWRMVAITASILLLAGAVLLIRYGHVRYPYDQYDHKD
jgi:protein PsiE